MTEKEVLEDLRRTFPHLNGKIYLKPTDLVPVIRVSVGQQANLRSEGRFSIPLQPKEIGMGVSVSIYDLAKYIATNGQAFAEKRQTKAGRTRAMAFWNEVDNLVLQHEAEYQHEVLDSVLPDNFVKPTKKSPFEDI